MLLSLFCPAPSDLCSKEWLTARCVIDSPVSDMGELFPKVEPFAGLRPLALMMTKAFWVADTGLTPAQPWRTEIGHVPCFPSSIKIEENRIISRSHSDSRKAAQGGFASFRSRKAGGHADERTRGHPAREPLFTTFP